MSRSKVFTNPAKKATENRSASDPFEPGYRFLPRGFARFLMIRRALVVREGVPCSWIHDHLESLSLGFQLIFDRLHLSLRNMLIFFPEEKENGASDGFELVDNRREALSWSGLDHSSAVIRNRRRDRKPARREHRNEASQAKPHHRGIFCRNAII